MVCEEGCDGDGSVMWTDVVGERVWECIMGKV